ncbi:MAG: ROK family protein [Gemmatimonadetes bacterium]|nr:MAG: ROK family protein [Gemmatimonadota bacterium]
MKPYLGIDVGGTFIKVGLVSDTGTLLHHEKVPTEAQRGGAAILDNIVEGAKRCVAHAQMDWDEIAGAGVGVPGLLDAASGIVRQAPNLPDWDNLPVRDRLTEKLGIPVQVENDANAAAFGEWWVGAGQGVDHLIGLTLGTGVGGGLILNGKIYHGAIGAAAELGHMTIDPYHPYVKEGIRGSLEALASGLAIVKFATEGLKSEDADILLQMVKENDNEITPYIVYKAAQAGDSLSAHIYHEVGTFLGIGIANLIHIFNPQMVVIAGGIAAAYDLFAPPMMKQITERTFETSRQCVQIAKAQLGEFAGLIGAAASIKFKD